MKKSIIISALFFFFSTCVIYNILAQTRIPNPERGLRFEEMAKLPGLQFPWDSNRKLKSKTWCKDMEATYAATDGHVRIAQLYIYLSDFANTDNLSQAALDTMQSIFNGVRSQGYKLVLRYAYTYDGTGGYVYPPMYRILGHLDQLKPVIQANIDVIDVLQTGIIGLWGEWHNYNNVYSQTDKTNLLQKILEILPQNRHTMVRMPSYKNNLNLTADQKNRIGFHNDFFTDDQHVNANAWGYLATSNYNQVKSESLNVTTEGEMPYEGSNSTDFLNYVLDPIKSIRQLADHHYNSLSLTHNYNITFAGWKTTYLSKSQMDQNGLPYDPDYFNNGSRTVYDYVADHLGYRLYVDHANSKIVDLSSQINCDIKLINYGFSALHNPRQVYLVMTTSSDSIVDLVQVDTDPRIWHTGIINDLKGMLLKPAGLTNYKIGIWMPDFDGSQTKYDARYAVRLCNSNTTWIELNYQTNKKIGINVLNIAACGTTDSGSTGYCRIGGGANAQDRYIQSLQTTGGVANIISYSRTDFPIGGYNFYLDEKIKVPLSGNFNLSMINSPNTKWSRVIAWIDWDEDNTFDTSTEQLFHLGNAGSDNTNSVLNISQNITVPANTTVGQKRMRIRFYDAWDTTPGSCGLVNRTSTFDFQVDVDNPAPTYCPATGSATPNDRFIQSLTTTGGDGNIYFTNSTFPSNAYLSHTSTIVEVAQGSTFTLNMVNSANTKWSRVKCWIDWNHNGIFDDSGEEAFYLGNANSDNSATVLNISNQITVPDNATVGVTGIRIRFHDAWLTNPGPCEYASNTSTFDFQVKIKDASRIVPTYCSATGTSTPNDRYIQSLTTTGGVSNINFTNSAFPINAYMTHTASMVETKQSSTFTLNMANSANTKWSRVKCWIDWNHNGVFDDQGEEVFYLGNASSDNSATVLNISKLITVPANATIGTTGMRVRFHDAWLPNPGPCGNVASTATFDFQVEIDASQPQLTKLATDLGQINEIRDVKIYPNPATESITVFSDNEINNLSIYSIVGKVIKCIKNVNASNISIDISSLRQGVYLFQVEDRETHLYHYTKFIKE